MPVSKAKYDEKTGTMKEVKDALQNFVSHLGEASRDKGIAASFSLMNISDPELMNIYKQGGIGGKIIDCVAEDLGRVWRDVSIKDTDVEPFNEFQRKLKVRSAIVNQTRWARLFGSAVILIIIEGDNTEDELDIESVSPSKPLSGLRVEHRKALNSVETDMVTGRPTMYEVSRTGERFHPSRVIGPMDGIPLPPDEMKNNSGWGESILKRVYVSLLVEVQTALGINHVMTEAKTDVVGVKDLSMHLDGGSKQSAFEQRWMLAAQLKGLLNLLLIDDGTETFQTVSNATTIAGMGQILEKLANRISAEVDIPMTRLYGTLASGLSTSGATNQDDYYDMLTAKREMNIEPELLIIDELTMRSVYGRVLDGFSYKWSPFRELSVPEQADVDNKDANTAKTYIDAGAIVPGHVARRIKEKNGYPVNEDFVSYLEKRDGIAEGTGEAGSGEGEANVPNLGEEGGENDARILMEIAEAVKSGKIDPEQARVILESTFPDMDKGFIDKLVNVEVKKPEPPPQLQGQFQAPEQPPVLPNEEE